MSEEFLNYLDRLEIDGLLSQLDRLDPDYVGKMLEIKMRGLEREQKAKENKHLHSNIEHLAVTLDRIEAILERIVDEVISKNRMVEDKNND